VAEFDADVLIIGRTSERVSRTIRRLDVCRSQGLAFPRGERVMVNLAECLRSLSSWLPCAGE
jgi:hypothetical protein